MRGKLCTQVKSVLDQGLESPSAAAMLIDKESFVQSLQREIFVVLHTARSRLSLRSWVSSRVHNGIDDKERREAGKQPPNSQSKA